MKSRSCAGIVTNSQKNRSFASLRMTNARFAIFGLATLHPSLPQDLDRRSAQTELVEDLRDVLEGARDRGAVELLGHDDGVTGHQATAFERCREEPLLPLALHRAVGAQHV